MIKHVCFFLDPVTEALNSPDEFVLPENATLEMKELLQWQFANLILWNKDSDVSNSKQSHFHIEMATELYIGYSFFIKHCLQKTTLNNKYSL